MVASIGQPGKVRLEQRTYGDIWLRDTGPLVVCDSAGHRIARRFGFNGWGGKYVMDGDPTIGGELATDAGLSVKAAGTPWKLAPLKGVQTNPPTSGWLMPYAVGSKTLTM